MLLVFLGVLDPLEYWSLARFFEVRGSRLPVAPVVIVSIDEASIVELNQQWPFPRAMHARLLRTIAAAQAPGHRRRHHLRPALLARSGG